MLKRKDRPKITTPKHVAELMMPKMRDLENETVSVIALDIKGSVIGTRETYKAVQTSEPNASMFHPRGIFRFALEKNANSVVLVHNHPSGDPEPSKADIEATKQLIEAGKHIGIKVHDHIVIGGEDFISMKEESFV